MSQPKDELKRIQKAWYTKLEKEGFRDIEVTSINGRPLKSWHSFKYAAMDPVTVKAIQTYFEKAQDLLFTYKFRNRDHKKIWRLHCEGKEVHEIVKRVKYRRSMVFYLIDKIARINGLKK